jgi:hypothetical protein
LIDKKKFLGEKIIGSYNDAHKLIGLSSLVEHSYGNLLDKRWQFANWKGL